MGRLPPIPFPLDFRPLMNNFQCQRCSSEIEVHDEYIPPANAPHYVPGDIIALKESGHTPTIRILNKSPGEHVILSEQHIDKEDYKGRPAITLRSIPIQHEKKKNEHTTVTSTVYLLATFKRRFRLRPQLPLVLQHFGVAVYHHSAIAEDPTSFHLHTTPEWSNSRHVKDWNDLLAWLIAYEYNTDAPVVNRWWNVNSKTSGGSTFKVDREAKEELMRLANDKWAQWTAHCEFDLDYAERCIIDYHVRPACLIYIKWASLLLTEENASFLSLLGNKDPDGQCSSFVHMLL